jgi:hypothetical protein
MKKLSIHAIKPGTKVKLRNDLTVGNTYGSDIFVSGMVNSIGIWVTVTSKIGYNKFSIGNVFSYTIEMVERINNFKYGK